MTEMIAAEPALAERTLARLAGANGSAARLAEAIRATVDAGRAIVLTGCGTSEHAALGAVEILRDALGRAAAARGDSPPARSAVSSVQALELALDPPADGLVIGISHEGASWATNLALEAARAAGAHTAIVTVTDRSPGAAFADSALIVTTGELDESWCHTIGYLAPMLAAMAVGGHLAPPTPAPSVARDLVAQSIAGTAAAEAMARSLASAAHVVAVGSGADRPAVRELVLKIEEGAWIPSSYRDLETLLHGHLAACGPDTGLVLILADRAGFDARTGRALSVLRAAAVLGMPAGAILSAAADARMAAELTPAGRVVVPDELRLPAPSAALLGTAGALQLLTERIARARGTDPDAIRRADARYREAAEAAV